MADMTKQQWIREQCTDNFDGIPCAYEDRPNFRCSCSEKCQSDREREWQDHLEEGR